MVRAVRPPGGRRWPWLYFSLVDAASHDDGPDAREALAAAAPPMRWSDGWSPASGAAASAAAVNVVVVSDHGMAETRLDRAIVLDELVDPAQWT